MRSSIIYTGTTLYDYGSGMENDAALLPFQFHNANKTNFVDKVNSAPQSQFFVKMSVKLSFVIHTNE
jgi:hypothetical protein